LNLKMLAVAAGCVVLAACQTTEGKRTIAGENLGTGELQTIGDADGKLLVPSDVTLKNRKTTRMDLPNRYNENIQFAGGYITFEQVFHGGVAVDVSPARFVLLSKGWTLGSETVFAPTEDAVSRRGDILYTATTFKTRPCVAFVRVFGRIAFISSQIHYDSTVRGFHCGKPAEDAGAELERVLDLAGRLKVRGA
jgi:hypothetical protein